MTADPGFEAARSILQPPCRQQCQQAPKRLKWAGLLPVRHQREAFAALEEMQRLGARAAVVFGTAGERLLSDPSFLPVWDEFARAKLPLCVHMGMSYPPFADVCNGLLAAHGIGMSLPAQLAFMAIVGHRMLDRYPDLKVASRVWRRVDFIWSPGWTITCPRSGAHIWGMSMRKTCARKREEYVKSEEFLSPQADDKLFITLSCSARIKFCFHRISRRRPGKCGAGNS
jgi:hypothetical protein